MNSLEEAIERVLSAQIGTRKPLGIILAGHNGSGKSTMWRRTLSDRLQMPLVNADRLMLSILPEADGDGALVDWARQIRDADKGWMRVAQRSVQSFVAHAMNAKVPFAMETVFSHWETQQDGSIASKIELIRDMQAAGYFVLLLFVGLTDVGLSILRVQTRVAENGHDVKTEKLLQRFPRTQRAITEAAKVANASIFVDNSLDERKAFTVCRLQLGETTLFDLRREGKPVPSAIREWLTVVCRLV